MGSISTTTAIKHHTNLWIRSDSILNSSPLLFITLSLLFLPLTLTATTFIHDVITPTKTLTTFDVIIKTLTTYDVIIKTLTTYDVIKTLTIIIPTFTAATSLIILRTTHPRLTLISAVKSFPPLFTTVITETTLLLLSSLAIAFSPFAVTEVLGLGLGFDANLVKLGVMFVLVVSVVYMKVVWGFSAPVAVLEGRYGFAALRESDRQLVKFRGNSFLMVVLFGVFRIGPLLWMGVLAKDSTYVAHFEDWVLVVNRCAIYVVLSLVITQYVVMYTILYVQCMAARRDYQVCGYVDGEVYDDDDDDDDKVGGQVFTLLFNFFLLLWFGTTITNLQ